MRRNDTKMYEIHYFITSKRLVYKINATITFRKYMRVIIYNKNKRIRWIESMILMLLQAIFTKNSPYEPILTTLYHNKLYALERQILGTPLWIQSPKHYTKLNMSASFELPQILLWSMQCALYWQNRRNLLFIKS